MTLASDGDVAIITVATNRYIKYWKQMVESADRLLAPGSILTFYVFTDQVREARLIEQTLSRSRVVPILIPPLGWPDATLLRYQLFCEAWEQIQESLVIHLDADMYFSAEVNIEEAPYRWPGGLALVRHPGYRRPGLVNRLWFYVTVPKMLIADLRMRLRIGALGSWESSPTSLAYVPRHLRKTYVCGGTWMGAREPLGRMIQELANRTRKDLDRGVIATWHDESHLNWFASTHPHRLLDSEKCYASGYKNLRDLRPEIIAVDKGTDRTR